MERLDKLLASTGRWSRREVKSLVKEGRVLVDGVPAATLYDRELLEERELAYSAPALDEAAVREIARETLPDADIDRSYVVEMVLERGQRLGRKLERFQQQGSSGPALNF